MLHALLQMPGSSGSSGFARCGRRRTQGAGIETRGVECHGAALSRSDGGSERRVGHRGGRALWGFTQDGAHLEAALSRGRPGGTRRSLASTAPPSPADVRGDRSAHLQAPQGALNDVRTPRSDLRIPLRSGRVSRNVVRNTRMISAVSSRFVRADSSIPPR
jgi:hypothetical protein